MEDSEMILRVYPYNENELLALQVIEGSSHGKPPRVPPSATGNSRAANFEVDLDSLPYIEHRFQDRLVGSSKIVYGRDPDTCDVILPALRGVSRCHFALTYKRSFPDGCPRLVVRDLGSSWGTKVVYDGEGGELRRNFEWIIGGFEVPDTTNILMVQPHKDMRFRFVVRRHDIASPEYIDRVERFLYKEDNRASNMESLGPQMISSGSLMDHPILITMGWLAQGAFGAVSRHWNVSTGEEYACKRPLGQGYDSRLWNQEIRAMKSISHDHIVRLCFAQAEPPVMFLEYMRLGNLEDQHKAVPFSRGECLTILRQSLSALECLHGRRPPMAHRDIKPENILVEQRDCNRSRPLNPELLRVKLSDFGLSKDGTLKTYCGTRTYCPPEVRRETETYTKAVDIWSLGVVLLRFTYGLPLPRIGEGPAWCRAIARAVQRLESRGLAAVLQGMLVMEPDARNSATACLEEASLVVLSAEEQFLEEKPVSPALPPLERRHTRSIGSYCRLESAVVLSHMEGESR